MSIRAVTARDIGAVCKIEALSFSAPWAREAFDEVLEGGALFLCEERSGRPIAYIIVLDNYDFVSLAGLAVHPAFRRRGHARALLQAALEKAKEAGKPRMTLEVRVGNAPAIALYQSMGFQSAGTRPRYYDDGEDALIMWREEER